VTYESLQVSSQNAQHAKWTHSGSDKYNCSSALGHTRTVFVWWWMSYSCWWS